MEIAHRDLAALYAFWGSKRGQRAYPARRDFLPEEFRDWMGHIGIVEAEYDPQRFKVRLSGTFIVDYEGRDYTGKYLDDVVPPHDLDDVVAPYTRVIETGQPAYMVLEPGLWGLSTRHTHRVLLPCASDGKTIDQVIVGIYLDNGRYGISTGKHGDIDNWVD